ncbi:MAG: NUDIX domain-containing protein [Actinophytocola sp.]|nr:NUDIX domain-containing protein [Actinophytocola sp.]
MCEASVVLLGDGDGFVRCACGSVHWGTNGAAGLLLSDPERGVLLQRRAWWVHHGRTWALPGGALRSVETAEQAAIREAEEEADVPAHAVRLTATSVVDHGTWRYTTVLASVNGAVDARVANAESTGMRWVPPHEVAEYPLHRDFARAWPALREHVGRRLVLVVDAANVMGSVPDGWWRDRAGAAERLRDRLAVLAADGISGGHDGIPGSDRWRWLPRIVLVVEGAARSVAGLDGPAGVGVVAAERDGDSAIVEVTREALAVAPDDHVLVATADRELRARIEAEGARPMGPSALLGLLPP